MKSILIPFFLFLISISLANAEEGNKGYCQQAETTVDLIDCIGARYKAEIAHMNELYQKLMSNDDASLSDFQTTLKTNQNQWIEYRDKKCEFEGSIYKGGSLERVQQLSCLARTTKERSDHLNALIVDDRDIPVFASPPRWKNTLIHDYPDTYWALGNETVLDTDCDGVNERIVRGVNLNNKIDSAQTVWAIADSRMTGRPVISLLKPEWANSCMNELPNFETGADNEGCIKTHISKNTDCDGYVLTFDQNAYKYTFSLPTGDIQTNERNAE